MKFFGVGKKSGDLKTLSEKEIQVKLYGHLRSPHAGASRDGGVATLPKPSVAPALPTQQLSFTPEKTASGVSTHSGVKTAPMSEAQPKKSFQPAKPKTSIFSTLLSFLTLKLLPGILKIIKAVAVGLIQLLIALIGAITQIFLKVDFKNPRVRRTFYWTFGVGILFFLFAGIHVLNMKREFAMRHPNRVVPVKAKPLRTDQQIPAKVTSQALLSESPETRSASGQDKTLTPATPEAPEGASSTSVSASAEESSAFKGQAIQIATFATQVDADKLVERLKTDGWKSFAKPLVRPGGRTYYCVFLGPFKTYQEAETKLSAFKKKDIAKPFQDAFIRSL